MGGKPQTRGKPDEITALMLRAQGGDGDAYARLYAALFSAVRDFIGSLDGHLCPHEREDLTQEVFAVVWERRATYRGESSAKTFILAIARNLTFKQLSKRSKLPILYAGDADQVPGQDQPVCRSLETSEVDLAVAKALAQLTEPQRQAIELVSLQGLSRSEALKLANCSANQFQKRLQRAAEMLRSLLRNSGQSIWK